MKFDWDTRIDIRDQNILLHKRNSDMVARVTIGLPTYRRGHLIRRALASIGAQTYRDFVLVISDNAGKDPETMAAVEEFSEVLPEVVLIAQEKNIGAFENLKFLLATAETEYFMWLADDDEISPDYLEELVNLLDNDRSTVTAMGKWMGMTSQTEGKIRSQLRPDDAYRLYRLIKFVAGNADDSAYYGVHRTHCLRQSWFTDYLPPNRGVLTNFCYIILFDMLWLGRIQYGQSATWVCHNYSEKEYNRALARGVSDRIRTLLRRLNVYLLYIRKTARKGPELMPVIFAASLVGFTRDVVTAMWRVTGRAVRHGLSA